jgi:hypothetical protein
MIGSVLINRPGIQGVILYPAVAETAFWRQRFQVPFRPVYLFSRSVVPFDQNIFLTHSSFP